MSDTGLTVPCMTESPRRYDVTITVDRDGGDHPDPAEFAVAAGQAASTPNRVRVSGRCQRSGSLSRSRRVAAAAEKAASSRAASVVSAHTAEQIISVVTVRTADRPAAVAVALAVVSEALRRPVALPTR